MHVTIRYLGMLREITGLEAEPVELADGAVLGDLYASLQHRIPQLHQFRQAIALAVNYEYAGAETRLREGDEVALIPPVSGGAPEAAASANTTPMQTTDHAAIVRNPSTAQQFPRRFASPTTAPWWHSTVSYEIRRAAVAPSTSITRPTSRWP